MGVETYYNQAMEKPLQILEIFNDFFGEDRVDMQGFPTLEDVKRELPAMASESRVTRLLADRQREHRGFILVHFPHVRVTNEYDKYVDINHLYAQVYINLDGTIQGRFLLNRSEYSVLHFSNGYMHSHISSIPIYNFEEFQTPCTGSGPINSTICSLSREFDADLWRLFCLELDRFVQVESISGTPYHRLESLTRGGASRQALVFTKIQPMPEVSEAYLGGCITYPQLAEFIKYVVDSNILRFNYLGDGYYLALPPVKYYIKISNLFIEWYNRKYANGEVNASLGALTNTIIMPLKFNNGRLYRETNNYVNYRQYIGRKVCTFKGQDVVLTISDIEEETAQTNNVYILQKVIADYIITVILNTLNFRYGNKKEENTPHKEVRFL